jgi:membrane protease YdiL (CAAX protease family)
VVIPLTIFGVAHWIGGWANILIALALGVILSVFYVWRRDLVANMISHIFSSTLSATFTDIVSKRERHPQASKRTAATR